MTSSRKPLRRDAERNRTRILAAAREVFRLRGFAATLASSFGVAFWWAFGLVVVACLVALVLLPKHKPTPVDDDAPAPTPLPG